MSRGKPNFLDLFAGAGGLSEGFMKNGYHDIAHVEMNIDACYTLRTRLAYYYLKDNNQLTIYRKYQQGLITRDELYKAVPSNILDSVINHTICEGNMKMLFDLIDKNMKSKRINKIDFIIGGPPCQAYSLVGRARKDDGMKNDPRNYLYILYCQIIDHYKPKMLVFENVQGLYSAGGGKYYNDLKKRLDEIGYIIHDELLQFKDYGLLQDRKRVILIGWRKEDNRHYPKFKPIKHSYLVGDLFSDLPFVLPGQTNNHYSGAPSLFVIENNIRENGDILSQNECRSINQNDSNIYSLAIAQWNDYHQRLNYKNIPVQLMKHNNKTSFLDRFKVVAADLPTCQTMVAHISKDGHYFIHPDIAQCRSITVREAARIQSFPDNYFFEGSRTSQFTQIGNAVPPMISNMIAHELLKQL